MTGTTIRRFSRNIWALSVSNVLYRLVSVGVSMYLGRALGAGVLGEYATVTNVLALFLSFADLGVTNYIIKEVSKRKELSVEYLNNFFALQVFVGLAVALSILATGMLSGYPTLLLIALAIGCLGPFFSGLSNAYNALLNAHEYIYPFAMIEMICMVVFLAGNVAVVLLHEGLIALITVTVIVSVVKFLLGREWSKRFGLRVRWEIDRVTVKRLLVMGLPFLVINGAHYAIQRLDILFLSWTVSEARVGMYAAASRLIFASLFFINSAGTALYPVLSRFMNEDERKARDAFRRSNTLLIISANYTALLFFILAPLLIAFLYGKGFDDAVTVLRILSCFIPLFAYGLLSNILLMVGTGIRRAVAASVAGLLVMIAGEPFFIARWGINGAAAGVLLAEAVSLVVFVAGAQQLHRFGYEWKKIPAALAGLPLSVLVPYYALRIGPLGQAVAGILIYTLVLAASRAVTIADLKEIISIFFRKQAVTE